MFLIKDSTPIPVLCAIANSLVNPVAPCEYPKKWIEITDILERLTFQIKMEATDPQQALSILNELGLLQNISEKFAQAETNLRYVKVSKDYQRPGYIAGSYRRETQDCLISLLSDPVLADLIAKKHPRAYIQLWQNVVDRETEPDRLRDLTAQIKVPALTNTLGKIFPRYAAWLNVNILDCLAQMRADTLSYSRRLPVPT